MRGISLEEIAEATKIGTRSLQALETEDFDKLPGGIFNKGFVRAYAKYLGIDEEQAVSDYLAAIGESREEDKPVETLKAVAAAKQAAAEAEGQPTGSLSGAIGVAAIALLLIAIAGVGGWQYLRSRAAAAPAPPPSSRAAARPVNPTEAPAAAVAPETAPPVTASAKPAETKTAAPSPAPPPKAAKTVAAGSSAAAVPFELLIRAKEDSWMSIVADGKEVMSGTLKATTETSVKARDRVILKVGNAGGVEISHNGKPVAPIGDPGQARTVTFTAAGLQR